MKDSPADIESLYKLWGYDESLGKDFLPADAVYRLIDRCVTIPSVSSVIISYTSLLKHESISAIIYKYLTGADYIKLLSQKFGRRCSKDEAYIYLSLILPSSLTRIWKL